MRVLLLGATGNLGSRCIPAILAHKHDLIVYVRNTQKLQSLMLSTLIEMFTVVEGDATDAARLTQTLVEHDIDTIVNVAGNQVPPWKDYVLPAIAAAVIEASVKAGRARGMPLRLWNATGLGAMEYPLSGGYLIKDL
jgi:uncharacterized protein YbjT (DUF2867 family)